jgi:hypothetical protein
MPLLYPYTISIGESELISDLNNKFNFVTKLRI